MVDLHTKSPSCFIDAQGLFNGSLKNRKLSCNGMQPFALH